MLEFILPAYNPGSQQGYFQTYLNGLVSGIPSILRTQMILFVIIAALTLFLKNRMGLKLVRDFGSLIILALVSSFIIRYFLHPVMEDRFLLACYLLTLVEFYKTLAQNSPSSRNTV